MSKIRIKYQDASAQYDEDYNQITEWNEKYCSWIVLPEYEESYYNNEIDWWGEDNDFPRGCTKKEYLELFPNADNYPDIYVAWYWDEEGYRKMFKESPTSKSQLMYSNTWGYLDYDEEKSIKFCGHYCDFNKYAYKTVIKYNGKIIFEGKLE